MQSLILSLKWQRVNSIDRKCCLMRQIHTGSVRSKITANVTGLNLVWLAQWKHVLQLSDGESSCFYWSNGCCCGLTSSKSLDWWPHSHSLVIDMKPHRYTHKHTHGGNGGEERPTLMWPTHVCSNALITRSRVLMWLTQMLSDTNGRFGLWLYS